MTAPQDLFALAAEALVATVSRIPADRWNADVPSWLSAGEKERSLRDVVASHATDLAWVSDTLAGRTLDEVGDAHAGDLLGQDPGSAFTAIAERAAHAARSLPDQDLDRTTHLSYGDYPAREYLAHISTYHGFRAYTIAEFLGVDSTLPPALVDGLTESVLPEVEMWRSIGVFGPAVDVPGDADAQTRLLGLTGFLRR